MCVNSEGFKQKSRDFPGGPVIKNLPSNVGDTGFIPSQRTKVPHDAGELSQVFTTRKPTCHN